jgi:hypothetical protein
VPILTGGVIQSIVRAVTRKRGDEEAAVHRGILFGSGLIAGEAIMGIIVAFLIVGGISLPLDIFGGLTFFRGWFHDFTSLVVFAAAIVALVAVSLRHESNRR